MINNITRRKTSKPEVWNLFAGNVCIGTATAKHTSPTVRSWNLDIKVPLNTGKPATCKIKDSFSIKQAIAQAKKELRNVKVRDIAGYEAVRKAPRRAKKSSNSVH